MVELKQTETKFEINHFIDDEIHIFNNFTNRVNNKHNVSIPKIVKGYTLEISFENLYLWLLYVGMFNSTSEEFILFSKITVAYNILKWDDYTENSISLMNLPKLEYHNRKIMLETIA